MIKLHSGGVVCGGIAFCVYFAFFYDKYEKGSPHDQSDTHR